MDRLQQKLTPKAANSFGKKPNSRVVLGRNDPYLRRELFNAAKQGKINTLNALLENQFGTPRVPVNSIDGVDGMDGLGWNALHYLCSSDPLTKEQFMQMDPDDPIEHGKCLSLLCNWGINKDLRDNLGRTPLHIAVMKDRSKHQIRLVQRLLHAGVDMGVETKDKKTAIIIARETGNEEVEKLFIDREIFLVSLAAKSTDRTKKEKNAVDVGSIFGCCAAKR